ncbi:MAG: hypothetical protein H6672_18155 [Anaerolineaceae bacterium]|nr:hypothetical protein [Anaerolineaceae bacterium]
MMKWIQWLTGPLPEWIRADSPFVRYELAALHRSAHRNRRRLQMVGIVGVIILSFWAGYIVATGFFQHEPGYNLTESLRAILFWPVLLAQVVAQISVLLLTVSMVSEQQHRQAWDDLRGTANGVRMSMRARWAVVLFYRLRWPLLVIYAARVLMILGLLYDLTAFQGHYLDLLLNGVMPTVTPVVAVLLLVLLMAAALLLPLTSLGLDAAVGLLLATRVQQRTYSTLAQIIMVLFRLALVALIVWGATQFVAGRVQIDAGQGWLLLAAFGAMGDWSLSFLHLSFMGSLWLVVPYSLLLGAAFLLFALAQAALIDVVFAFAVRRAERAG